VTRLLKIVIISRSFGTIERKLLAKNSDRARRVFGAVKIAYVLGERDSFDVNPLFNPLVSFYYVTNPPSERNAALSRGIGYKILSVVSEDIVLFLDSDMLVTENYLRFLRNLNKGDFLALCNRVDIRSVNGAQKRTYLKFSTSPSARFSKLYGSIALRGIAYQKYNVMTHDMEEQWFLRALEKHPARHEVFDQVGILHFDRFSGVKRAARLLKSSRGVGIWQGVFRDMTLSRIASDTRFVIRQKRTVAGMFKLFIVSVIGLPKIFLFTLPRKLNYKEISCDQPKISLPER
jgi:hypothetical protein